MTGPVNNQPKTVRPVDYKTIGGVKFNANDVESSHYLKSKFRGDYTVELKNGMRIVYDMQKGDNVSVFTSKTSSLTDPSNVVITNLKNASIYDQPYRTDNIKIRGGQNNTVNISDEHADADKVLFTDSKEQISKGNKVLADANDNVRFNTKRAKVKVKGEGTTSEESLSKPEKSIAKKAVSIGKAAVKFTQPALAVEFAKNGFNGVIDHVKNSMQTLKKN